MSKHFFTSKAFLIGVPVVAGVAIALSIILTKKDYIPDPINDNCFTISKKKMTRMLPTGFNDPRNAQQVPSLLFFAHPQTMKLDVMPTDKDTIPLSLNATVITAVNPTGGTCSLARGTLPTYSRYDFISEDAGGNGEFNEDYEFVRFVPTTRSEQGVEYICFEVFMVKVEEGREIATSRGLTKPCPPFCPTR